METVRKESSSEAVSKRKNRKRIRTRRKKVGRKKMGYKMDGIFRMYVDNMEYGAVEVAKKFEETELLADGNKSEETVSCRHASLGPKGYVSILKREKLLEIPATIEKIRDLIRVLANVWMLKRIVLDCVETLFYHGLAIQNKEFGTGCIFKN
ncbi:hypothetical protein GLOIN_2v1552276 [Rhizophagus clarus]|uniref:Uncharacterized protein n=1 Tax=Rhizophagus clarus TaxID=94130 RepID=A0A8H3M557_9GLOM|nr:hypothetical protein GLOIN_2v1552276 [Rhizophagus clarus]